MAIFNSAPTAVLSQTYNALLKWVTQYIESGNIRSKFDYFEGEDLPHGVGFEINVVLGAQDLSNAGTTKASEHSTYAPKVFTIFASTDVKRQYGVTIDESRLQKCTNDEAKLREYAAEIVDSLMQGWIRDKNAKVYEAIAKLLNVTNTANVALTTDKTVYSKNILEKVRAVAMDYREGVTGTSYGNAIVGSDVIASNRIAVIMSNTMYAMISANGLADAFNKEDLEVNDVKFIATNKMSGENENAFIVTDARNIHMHKKYESNVMLQNSDGSVNHFYNVEFRVDALVNSSNVAAFPCVVVTGEE